ncbi:MAG TPA: glycosyltransferase family 2 protein [Pirellulales bacterium]|nr:glycosyltransferase family 2 protein [Pirellulales bacterium]
MPKLSILIAAHDETLLEASLVSVLQSRPADCEVVVVHDESYQDPYDLAGEVRFVATSRASEELARLNLGLAHCRGSVIHVLRSGAEVTDGWTQAALAHFADPTVAAVAPLVMTPDGQQIASSGVAYHPGGKRIARGQAQSAQSVPGATETVLGPTLDAAFYRAGALNLLRDAFCLEVGSEMADVDLALRLSRAGYRAIFEPASRVVAPRPARTNPLVEAWLAERLYWRHAKHFGMARSLAAHAAVVGREFTLCLVRPLRVGCVLGRAAAFFEHALTRRAPQTADRPQPPPTPRTDLRLDPAVDGGISLRRRSRQRTPEVV